MGEEGVEWAACVGCLSVPVESALLEASSLVRPWPWSRGGVPFQSLTFVVKIYLFNL